MASAVRHPACTSCILKSRSIFTARCNLRATKATKMISKKYATAVMALLMLAAVSGCQKKDDTVSAGPAEQLGRNIDEATAKADQQITDATKETSQKIDKATG